MKLRALYLALFLSIRLYVYSSFPLLTSTEADPDSFIDHCVNVINGDYCESATDLVIAGPDPLVLQRFYSTRDYVTGEQPGGWRIFPQRFLVIGKDSNGKTAQDEEHGKMEWSYAFTGERSGGILTYSGWRNAEGVSPKSLKIDIANDGIGMTNTYAKEINGQTNHSNNLLYRKKDQCKLILGDGTQRFYERVNQLPTLILGEELIPSLASKVVQPEYWRLRNEKLPSGNVVSYSYDKEGHLASMEMKNASQKKVISWMHISYAFFDEKASIKIETSDAKRVDYHLTSLKDSYRKVYALTEVQGSHLIPCSYQYILRNSACHLIKKSLPEGRFKVIEYDDKDRVKALKTVSPEPLYTFKYGENTTTVTDALGRKVDYQFNENLQLTALRYHDKQGQLYRVETKVWGQSKTKTGLLVAKTIGDGNNHIYSYRSFKYDNHKNVIEERLYGGLTCDYQNAVLQFNEKGKPIITDKENCHRKTFAYSEDKLNLLVRIGNAEGNQIVFHYEPNTNLLSKKFVYDRKTIKQRTYYEYNDDAACVTVIEDDGSQEEQQAIEGCTERHITSIKLKEKLPGVGLPEIIEKKALDLEKKQELLVQKQVKTYDAQANLLTCETYDSNGNFAYREQSTYNHLGQLLSETNRAGKKIYYTYDLCGNCLCILNGEKTTLNQYDLQNRLIQTTIIACDIELSSFNTYDLMGRKISSTDFGGHTTHYEYDDFDRLTKIIHPEVKDENENPIRPTFSYTYDLFGNVASLTDPKGFTIYKTYNLRGLPVKVTYPDESYELFTYDPEGSLRWSSDRHSASTDYHYDHLGRVISLENFDSDADEYRLAKSTRYQGSRRIEDKEEDLIKHYTYDSMGRLSKVVVQADGSHESDSRCTTFAYDSLGRIAHKQIWFGIGPDDYTKECFDYDISGNLLEKRIEDAKGHILFRKGFTYDNEGKCLEEYGYQEGKRISLIKTTYNALGDPICWVDASGNETKVIIDYQNALGVKKTLVNALGVRTEMEFDPLGRLFSVSKHDPMGTPLSLQKIIYDTVGNKSREIHAQISNGKLLGLKTLYWRFGPMGRVEEEGEVNGESCSYTYNYKGQLIAKNSSAGLSFNYRYQRLGKIKQIESSGEQPLSHQFTYDQKGNILKAETIDGITVERKYNVFHQVLKETIQDKYGQYTTLYTYDRKGRLTSALLPDQSKIVYAYNALFGKEAKHLSAKGEILYCHHYDRYNEQGKLLSEKFINQASSQEHFYNLNSQKIQSSNDFLTEKCQRDPLGRIIEVKKQATFKTDNAFFTYNDLSQLISEKTKLYTCDSLDNRLKTNQDTLIYNAFNQLIASPRKEFVYDEKNSISKILEGTKETNLTSDRLSQLIAIKKPNQTHTFSYDAFGRLITHQDTKNKTTSRFLYIGYHEIGSLNEKREIETLRIPGLCGEELSLQSIAIEINKKPYVPIHDFAGNVTALIDPTNRKVVESYTYSAFGEETISKGENPINPWRFAEKRKINQFVLFCFRFYDPSTGRWISSDPIGFADGPNSHAYLHHNPISYRDRFGLASENKEDGVIKIYVTHNDALLSKRDGNIGRYLPKITYCESFEQFYAVPKGREDFWASDEFQPRYENSSIFDLGLPELSDMEIGYINGIDTTKQEAIENARHLSKLTGGYNIHAVYNATHGIDIDLMECTMGLNYIATEPVHQLHKMWNSYFEKASAKGKFLMVCHSQGAIHVRNALLDYPPELRERILVVAIAPGGYIYKETCAQVIHYRAAANRDFIPQIDRAGAIRSRETIFDLESHPDAPGMDHTLRSPTYHRELREHITNYINMNGSGIS